MNKNIYTLVVTDTFAGEANFSWVNRFKIKASSVQGAITAFAKIQGDRGWRFEYGDPSSARYNLKGACVCVFVEFFDEFSQDDSDYTLLN